MLRPARLGIYFVVCELAVLFAANPARADPTRSVPPPASLSYPDVGRAGFQIGAGAQVTLGFGDACRRELSDVTSCTTGGPSAAGFVLSPRWRFESPWSIGALVHAGWSNGGDSLTTLARFAADVRWLPLHRLRWTPWIGIDGGAVLALDSLAEGELGPHAVYSSWAPAIGVGIGLDFATSPSFAIGLEARGAMVAFGAIESPVLRQPQYEDQLAVTLALVGSSLP